MGRFRFSPAACAIALGLIATYASGALAAAQPASFAPRSACTSATREGVALALVEASRRFRLPASWLHAVVRVESAGCPCATSPKGAMGLMQVMPQTYAELRLRYGFGPDPYAVRDNIMAGSAYLREMVDRFGPVGALAAYNAGPGRYREHLAGRPLPLETRAYVARLAPAMAAPTVAPPPIAAPAPVPLDVRSLALRSSLFAGAPLTEANSPTDAASADEIRTGADVAVASPVESLFAPRGGFGARR